jgi:hypothetical protein
VLIVLHLDKFIDFMQSVHNIHYKELKFIDFMPLTRTLDACFNLLQNPPRHDHRTPATGSNTVISATSAQPEKRGSVGGKAASGVDLFTCVAEPPLSAEVECEWTSWTRQLWS